MVRKNYGESNGNWKCSNVGMDGLHAWVISRLGKPNKCAHCKTEKAKRYDWANISKEYKRENGLEDWIRLCRVCHKIFDEEFGENHHLSKLNNEQVINIRKMWLTNNFTMINLAIIYKVSDSTISNIVHFRKWKHI